MTILRGLLVFLPSILCGFFIVHLIWKEIQLYPLILKAFMGIGVGLGINSILFFASLLTTQGRLNILLITFILLAVLALLVFLRDRRLRPARSASSHATPLQWGLGAAAALAVVFLTLSFLNLINSQPQGAFDSWAIWNRASRFIYRDPSHWNSAFSPDLDWSTHPDYPLLVPFNTAWGWQVMGAEIDRIPMILALFFMLGSVGLIFASLGLMRTSGQASLGVILLSGMPAFALAASGLLADVPVMYYILGSVILIHLSLTRKESGLMVLAGFMAGLAAWTKNEGLLFLLAGILGLVLTRYADLRQSLIRYTLGAALPLAVVLYFKSLAPPNDIFASGKTLELFTDPVRYGILLKALGNMALRFGDWPFSLPLALLVYALVVHLDPPPGSSRNIFTIAAIIFLQFLGVCAVYLLTPHDLEWHLRTSLARVILQVYPSGLFIYLLALRDPETFFA